MTATEPAIPMIITSEDPDLSKIDLRFIIRNGKIVDGSGQPSFMGDIAIQNDRIVKIGLVLQQLQ